MSVADERLSVPQFPAPGAEPTVPASARRRETQRRLLTAAAAVFAEAGLQGASVEAICARAGFSRGAFYSNFESKEQLFLELLQREFARRTAHLKLQAAAMEPELRQAGRSLGPAQAAGYVAEFFLPEADSSTWFVLETEFLLLALREPGMAQSYSDFMARFEAETVEPVLHIVGFAGRRFTIPVDQAVSLLTAIYERELRAAALSGRSFAADYDRLAHRLAEFMFAITEPLPTP